MFYLYQVPKINTTILKIQPHPDFNLQIIFVSYLPPFKARNTGGQIFLSTIPIPVPIMTVNNVGIKY